MNWECLWPTAIWEWQRVLNIRYPKFAASSFSCSTAMSRYPPDLQTLAHGSTSQCIPMKHCHNHNIPPRHFYHHSFLFSQMPKKNPLVIMAMALEYQWRFYGGFPSQAFLTTGRLKFHDYPIIYPVLHEDIPLWYPHIPRKLGGAVWSNFCRTILQTSLLWPHIPSYGGHYPIVTIWLFNFFHGKSQP